MSTIYTISTANNTTIIKIYQKQLYSSYHPTSCRIFPHLKGNLCNARGLCLKQLIGGNCAANVPNITKPFQPQLSPPHRWPLVSYPIWQAKASSADIFKFKSRNHIWSSDLLGAPKCGHQNESSHGTSYHVQTHQIQIVSKLQRQTLLRC